MKMTFLITTIYETGDDMTIRNLLFVTFFALLVGACGTTTEQKKAEGDETTAIEKKDESKTEEKKPVESTNAADSPKASVKAFVDGVIAKDESAMKGALAAETLKMFEMMAKTEKKSFFEVITDNDEEDMKIMPEMRNEKIDGDKATMEIKEPKGDKWETMNFVKENGGWKISLFSKDQVEKMMEELVKEES